MKLYLLLLKGLVRMYIMMIVCPEKKQYLNLQLNYRHMDLVNFTSQADGRAYIAFRVQYIPRGYLS